MMVGLIAGFLYLPRLLQRLGTRRTLYLAYAGLVLVTVLNTTLAALVPPGLIHLLPLAAYAFAIAVSMPLLVSHALHPFPDNAGLAASCQLFLQYSLMAVVAGLLAPLLWDSLSHLALGCAVLTSISMTLLLWQRYATYKAQEAVAIPGRNTHLETAPMKRIGRNSCTRNLDLRQLPHDVARIGSACLTRDLELPADSGVHHGSSLRRRSGKLD
jgi:MFS family permease